MKKFAKVVLCLLLIGAVAACGGSKDSTGRGFSSTASVNDVLENKAAEEKQVASETAKNGDTEKEEETETSADDVKSEAEAEETNAENGSEEGIDVDLTTLSTTMVYSEVYNMMYYPEDYVGKVVKMEGAYNYLYDEATGNVYHACIVKDATACCATGIEFVLSDDYTYPDDYPEDGGNIGVIGTFSLYEEDGQTYCTLLDSKLF